MANQHVPNHNYMTSLVYSYLSLCVCVFVYTSVSFSYSFDYHSNLTHTHTSALVLSINYSNSNWNIEISRCRSVPSVPSFLLLILCKLPMEHIPSLPLSASDVFLFPFSFAALYALWAAFLCSQSLASLSCWKYQVTQWYMLHCIGMNYYQMCIVYFQI